MKNTLCDNSKYVLLPLSIIVVLSLLGCAGMVVKNTPVPGETPTVTQQTPTLTTTPSPTIIPSPVPVTETLAYESVEAHPILWPTENWTTSVPEEQGIDSQSLEAMFRYVQDGSFGLNSIFIVRNGFLVAEDYYAPFQPDSAQHLFSGTKSVISILIGMAIQDGYIDSVDQPVLDFFPDIDLVELDERKRRMTIAHLLTMTSGLDWREMAPYNGDSMAQMIASPNWVEFVLGLPMAYDPGEVFSYSSGVSHVLSALLQEATGLPTLTYAQDRLFTPLGISDVVWRVDPQGINIGGWGLSLTTRDMAKLGYLYLHQGLWEGEQIVPADWVAVSTTWHTTSTDSLDGWGYGYQWWLIPELPYQVFEARGLLGQHIMVVPDLDMVVVFTSRSENHNIPIEILEDYILPSIQPVNNILLKETE